MLSKRSIAWIAIGGAAVVAIAIILVLSSARLFAIYALFWGRDQFWSLFYEGLGFNDNVSKLLSLIATWVYIFAYAGFFAFLTRCLFRRDLKQHILGFVSFIIFFGLAPLVHVVYQPLGQSVCFNQRDGKAQKWYIITEGKVLLFDSGGYDPLTGLEKLRVTSEICRIHQLQRAAILPSKISIERAIELFPNVWYASIVGNSEFFDNAGVYPGTTEILKRVPDELIKQVHLRLEVERRERAQFEQQRVEEEKRQREAARTLEEARLAKEKTDREAELVKQKLELEKEQARQAEFERRERTRIEREQHERERKDQIRMEAERREQLRLEREQRGRDREASLRAEAERQQRARLDEQQQCQLMKRRASSHCSNLACVHDAEKAVNC